MITPDYDYDTMYIHLIDQSGIHLTHIQSFDSWNKPGVGQAIFSPDGSMYVFSLGHTEGPDGITINLFDFDRATGLLSNYRRDDFLLECFCLPSGVAFSADSKLLYANSRKSLYQYNVEVNDFATTRLVAAVYDGYEYFYEGGGFGWPTDFGPMKLGPDGRIYMVPLSGGNRKMHRMDYPNERGKACMMNQHSIQLASFARTMTNTANYRLGPLDGSPADTLGLDNHPIAKYRYEQDTLDYLTVRFTDLSYFRPETWHWDMGDGTTTTEQYPYHTYEKNGVYEVCLTVSNENSSNTSCRTLTIGTSSTEDTDINIEVSTYPNPFVDQVLVTLGEYIPQDGYFVVYDISGHEVARTRIYYGWNDIDLAHLSSGTYIWQMMDRGVMLKSGKMVK
jgi:hypothetical protein